MKEKKKKARYTREELIAILQNLTRKLGKVPAKKDLSDTLKGQFHREFGKWCYALEEAGVRVPSEQTLARRAHRKERWKKRHREMSYRRSAAGRAEYAEKKKLEKDNNVSDQHS